MVIYVFLGHPAGIYVQYLCATSGDIEILYSTLHGKYLPIFSFPTGTLNIAFIPELGVMRVSVKMIAYSAGIFVLKKHVAVVHLCSLLSVVEVKPVTPGPCSLG